jgi:hypothetical protein
VQAVETDDVGLMEDTADGTDDGDASDEDETGDGEEDEFQDCEGTDDDDDDPADDDDQATRNDGLFEIVRNSGSIIDKRYPYDDAEVRATCCLAVKLDYLQSNVLSDGIP